MRDSSVLLLRGHVHALQCRPPRYSSVEHGVPRQWRVAAHRCLRERRPPSASGHRSSRLGWFWERRAAKCAIEEPRLALRRPAPAAHDALRATRARRDDREHDGPVHREHLHCVHYDGAGGLPRRIRCSSIHGLRLPAHVWDMDARLRLAPRAEHGRAALVLQRAIVEVEGSKPRLVLWAWPFE
jgi:hypothetical protein